MNEYLVIYEDNQEWEDHGYILLGIFGNKQNAIDWVLKQIPTKYPNLYLKQGHDDYWAPKGGRHESWEEIHIDEIERLD